MKYNLQCGHNAKQAEIDLISKNANQYRWHEGLQPHNVIYLGALDEERKIKVGSGADHDPFVVLI